MLQAMARKWWVLLLRGLAAIALGILIIWWPGVTLLTLVILWGLFALLDGLSGILLGLRGETDGTMWWTMLLLGVLGVGAAITAFIWPGMTAVILLWIIAWTAILRGLFEIAAAIRLRKLIDNEWLLAISGLLSVVAGFVVLRNPAAGALAITFVIGGYMILMGIVAVVLSFRLRGIGVAA
ncbi:MAG TPA: DUF308 domain-containing protein [Candidatus Polarisedimenticolia bacterium]|nr:DUF308 domain-containing protein [Candidatus Polarisedimenticolia bacterium]